MEPGQQNEGRVIPFRIKTIFHHFTQLLQAKKIAMFKLTKCAMVTSILKILFWAVIYLSGSFITIKTCFELIQEYVSKPTYMQVINHLNNPNMTVPGYTLCIYANVTTILGSDKTVKSDYSAVLQEFLDNTTYDGIFSIGVNETFRAEVYFIIWKYLASIYETEASFDSGQNSFTALNHQVHDTDEDWSTIINVLVPKIAELNISIDQLKDVFDGNCLVYSSGLHCLASSISYMGDNVLCYEFKQKTIFESDAVNFLQSLQLNINLELFSKSSDYQNQNALVTIDFSGRTMPLSLPLPEDENIIVVLKNNNNWLFHVLTVVSILPIGVVKQLPEVGGVQRCSEELTQNECLDNCRFDWIRERCNCTPLTFLLKKQNDIPQCSFEKYYSCLNHSENEGDFELNYKLCKTACLPSCMRWIYNFDPAVFSPSYLYLTHPTGGYKYGGYGVLTFEYLSFTFVVYEETFQWTFEGFIGALGGSLAIWLGLDFIVLINFIFEPTIILFRKIFRTTEVGEVDNRIDQQEQGLIKICIGHVMKFIKTHAGKQGGNSSLVAIWIFEKFFWAVIYTAGGISTAVYCFQLCRQYVQGGPTSVVSLVFNKSIVLPPAPFCISYINKQSLGKKLYEKMNPEYKITASNYYSDSLNEFFNQTIMNKDVFLRRDINWPKALSFIIALYVSAIFDAEAIETGNKTSISPQMLNDICANNSEYDCDGEFSAAENILELKLKELNVTQDELRQKFGHEINQMIRLELNFVGSTSPSLLNETRLSYFDNDGLCYELPFDSVAFLNEMDYIEISADMSFFKDEEDYKNYMEETSNILYLGCLSADTCDLSPSFSLVTPIYTLMNNSISLAVAGHYKRPSTGTGTERCSLDHSKEICQAKCQIKLIQDLCHCSPTSWPSLLPPGAKECTLSDYKLYLNQNRTKDTACQRSCSDPCERWSYNHVQTPTLSILQETYPNLCPKYTFYARINVKDFTYISFEDQYQMTASQFLSTLGGLLGIWLGLDLRFIMWIIFTPIVLILGFFIGKNVNSTGSIFSPKTDEKLLLFAERAKSSANIVGMESLTSTGHDKIKTMKWLTKYILMMGFYIVGIFLTFKMCLGTYRDFQARPTNFNYTLFENQTLQLPFSLTVCVPLLARSQNEDYQGKATKFLSKLFNNKQKFFSNEYNWPQFFFQYMISYIILYSKCEKIDAYTENCQNSMEKSQWETFKIFDGKLTASNTTIRELTQKSGHEWGLMNLFSVKQQQQINGTVDCLNLENSITTTYIDKEKICFNFPINEFQSLSDFVEISFQKYFSDATQISSNSEVYERITIDLIGREFIGHGATLKFDSTLSFKLYENVSTALRIKSYYQAFPATNGVRKCSDQQSLEDCQNKCQVLAIQENCNCTPASWFLIDSPQITDQCTLNKYETCLPVPRNVTCIADCLRPCIQIEFVESGGTEGRTYYENPNNETHTIIHVQMRSFTYVFAQEFYTIGLSDFLGAFGGDLGFWIGLNCLIFVQLFYFSFTVFIHLCFLLKKKLTNGQQNQIAVQNVDDMELRSIPK